MSPSNERSRSRQGAEVVAKLDADKRKRKTQGDNMGWGRMPDGCSWVPGDFDDPRDLDPTDLEKEQGRTIWAAGCWAADLELYLRRDDGQIDLNAVRELVDNICDELDCPLYSKTEAQKA